MKGQTLLFLKFTLLIGPSFAKHCDRATTAPVQEGNIGANANFSWLGVLHVQLPEDELRVAMTGIVLIKSKYALVNADDVVRIPQNVFEKNSKAMFLVAWDTPWYAKPASYITHPEYEYSTIYTIAIVELNLDDVYDFPLTPICLPTPGTFSAARYFYLMGFTGANQMLEKVIYKIQYLDKTVCEEFYNRTGVSSQQFIPSAYLCGDAPNSVMQCVWENGMVLVSNETGYYDLIGFGIHGPGCAAPARFIDLFPYFSWIKSVTSPDDVYDEAGHRRKGNVKLIPNAPIHELYGEEDARRYEVLSHREYEQYPFDKDVLKFHIIEPTMENENALLIIPFNETWQEREGACKKPWVLMYNEYFELRAVPGKVGSVVYKLSLYDRAYGTCSCVRLTIDSSKRSEAVLAFKEEINLKENTELSEHSWETPDEIFKYYPIYQRTEKPKTKFKFQSDTHLSERHQIKDDDLYPRRVLNYDLYMKFDYTARAIMEFEMFAKPFNTSFGWHLPTTTEITTTSDPTSETTTASEMTGSTTTMSPNFETTEKPFPPIRRRAKSRVRKRPRSRWGMVNWADKMLKETKLSLVADMNEVQETESAARSEGEPGAVVVVCWLVSAFVRRAFFIY